MTNEPEESTRTAYAASILLAFDNAKKIKPSVTLQDVLMAARHTAAKRALLYTGAALVSGYLTFSNTQAQPPRYKLATTFALLATACTFGTKKNTRRLLAANHYIKMEATQGAYTTQKTMREFAAPSLRLFDTPNNGN